MRRARILLVNGNCRVELTDRMVTLAETKLGNLADIEAMTISTVPRFIANAKDADAAAPEIHKAVCARVLDTSRLQPDAVMLACFGEPGLWALRNSLPIPVTGMAEASAATALQLGRQFSILVSGQEWPAAISDLMAVYGMDRRCARITAVPDPAMAEDPAIWKPALEAALTQEAIFGDVGIVILGGGPLAGRAGALSSPPGMRVLDAFDTTLLQTFALALATRTKQDGV
ncbi:aspartate/glutamate racemase family protein [Yoonia sp.]|uniref:aspartate/glutamate racemase family protein n=1 Tax=Yoonia sp. TaxID=2212373 RepID=UPI003A4DF891